MTGLPAVGTVCEHEYRDLGWYVGTVVAHHQGWAIFFIDEDRIEAYAGGFRPCSDDEG
jgi:hypothetical protein